MAVVAGERARFAVTDDGKPVRPARGTGPVRWVPLWTTRYHIQLDNPGTGRATYFMVMQ